MKKLTGMLLAVVIAAGAVFAQDAQIRTLTAGQKYKLKGAIVARDDDQSFILRDTTGVDTRVVISPESSIKTKGGWFGGGDRIASTQLVRGLYLEAEGRGDGSGALTASKIRFDKDDFKVAQSIDTRVGPAETRLTAAEQNAQRLSGQIDELMAISNAARGGAKAAQETADAAVEGVNATIGLHICFGNFLGRPAVAHRTYEHIAPIFAQLHADIIHLEFANRGMWQSDIFDKHARDDQFLAAGVVDVKARAVEKPEIVAERIREILKHNDPARVWIAADCGFSMTARWVAREKLKAMVAGTKIVRRELGAE